MTNLLTHYRGKEAIPSYDRSVEDPNGFLQAHVILNRVGVMEYPERGELHYTSADVLAEAAPKYKGLPVLLEHPSDSQLVTSKNIENYDVVGFIMDTVFDGSVTKGIISIVSEKGKEAVRTTHTEVSCGYDQDLEEGEGVWLDECGIAGETGKKYGYDTIKKNIVPNHLSLVPRGRAGAIAKVYLDDAYTLEEARVSFDEDSFKQFIEKQTMPNKQLVFDSALISVADESLPIVETLIKNYKETSDKAQKLQISLDSSSSTVQSLTRDLEVAKTSLDAMTAKYDAAVVQLEAKPSVSMDSKVIGSEVQKLLTVWGEAKKIGSNLSFDSNLSAVDAKKANLKEVSPLSLHTKIDGSEAYTNALWDITLDSKMEEKEEEKEEAESDMMRYDSGRDMGSMYDNDAFKKKYGYKDNIMMGYDRRGSYGADASPRKANNNKRISEHKDGSFSLIV